ncbi:MAG: FAD-dependent oxidoreductase [Planctomycetaceae bacterium]|nr:FAD-dependent oxidoreductase [Planctomycetaceae bacterium]
MNCSCIRTTRLVKASSTPVPDRDHDILIIGGGVIGLCCGWYLSQAGRTVTILDRDPSRRESCSDENAGMVVPSHFIPLAAPGVISQGLKWMLNPKSPFYLRPRLDPALWSWCWQFFRHANAQHVNDTKQLLADFSLESRRLFLELADELKFDLATRGLMMLCHTEAGLEEEAEVAALAKTVGVEAEVCDATRVRELDPDVQMDVAGAVWFAQDCHLDPLDFLNALRIGIRAQGGRFLDGECTGFERQGDRLNGIRTADGETHAAEHVILAVGAWTPELARELDLRIPMQGGKGYSLTLRNPAELPRLCSLLKEARVAVTPMGGKLRVGGTMEICGTDLSINRTRLQGIIEGFCQFFPAFKTDDFVDIEPWSGLRPCTPDGLPCIGPIPGIANATVATGHNMLGLSLGPVTGQLVSNQVINGKSESKLEITRLAPKRFI